MRPSHSGAGRLAGPGSAFLGLNRRVDGLSQMR